MSKDRRNVSGTAEAILRGRPGQPDRHLIGMAGAASVGSRTADEA
jgi:hypothetical protein